ncbi:MAG TPA: C1 family peptidase [Opitutaceae bacterium]
MRRLRSHAALLLLLAAAAFAAEPAFKPGDKLATLAAGKASYSDVVIRSIGPRSVTITHKGGMTSVPLRELTPELQARFRYNPAAEQAAAAAPAPVAPSKTAPPPRKPAAPKVPRSALDNLLQQFGQPVTPLAENNLRPRFTEFGLGVRDQGARPSCAIYAIVTALEFQTAVATGKPQNFSEDYLIWATRKTTQRIAPDAPFAATPNEPGEQIADEGFLLSEVVVALRAYGIALQDQMPNSRGRFNAIATPTEETVVTARRQQAVAVHPIPGRETRTRLANIVHALDAGLPVPIGLAWPHWRTIRSGFLSAQKPLPGAYHAVTLVGYRSPKGTLEETQFIFKNSWGGTWGQGGYGTVTYGYLQQHITDAILLEVANIPTP